MKFWSHEIGSWNCCITLKFDRHFGSTAAEVLSNFRTNDGQFTDVYMRHSASMSVIFKHILRIMFMSISFEIALRWMPPNTSAHKSTLVQEMAWCNKPLPEQMLTQIYVSIWHDLGGWFNIKMPSYQYRKFHCGDKTILQPSYLHNGISYTGKTTSLYWIRAQATMS